MELLKEANQEKRLTGVRLAAAECPGGTIESCIKVCPGNTALLYGGCVQGCAERCDATGQFGQQGILGQNVQLGQQGQPIIAGQSNQQGQTDQSQGQYGQQNA